MTGFTVFAQGMKKIKNTHNLCIFPITMLSVKYKSPIKRSGEKKNPMNSELCTGAKETELQIGRALTVWRASDEQ